MRALVFGLVLALCAACATAPGPRLPRLSAQQLRDDTLLLARLERDLSDLEATRNVALASPPFDASQRAAEAELRRVDRELTRDASIHFPAHLPRGPQGIGAYRQAITNRNDRAMQLAQMQANERESSVAYAFDRSHNRALSDTKLRLRTLHLDARTKRSLNHQLATLNAERSAAVAAQRNVDDEQIATLRASLETQSAVALQNAKSDLRASHGVKLIAPQQTGSDVRGSIAASDAVSADIASRMAELRTTHRANVASLTAQIAALRAQCDLLKEELSRSSRDPGAAAASSPAR